MGRGIFQARVKRAVRIVAPVLTRAQRKEVGDVALNVVRSRIKRGISSDDQPAKPLKKGYAIQKTKKGKGNRRNWVNSGDMLASLRVTIATEKRIVISPTEDQRMKMARNQEIDPMFELSPKDEEEVNKIFELRALQNARAMVVPHVGGEFQ